jgi:hypothetical protein
VYMCASRGTVIVTVTVSSPGCTAQATGTFICT